MIKRYLPNQLSQLTNLGNSEGGTNDALKDAVEQPVHELGSTPRGCAPDPPVGAGVDSNAHAEPDDGFEKPRSPARSNVSVVRTRKDPELEDEIRVTPKLLWSDLVENEEELRNSVPQWYGKASTNAKDAKEKWKVPAPTETANEVPNNNDGPETMEPMEQTIRRLRETGLVEQLDSAEAVIRQQQAIIESLKRQKKRESIRPGTSGLNAEQKQCLGDRVINSGVLGTKVFNETQEESTGDVKLGSETSEEPKENPIARASSVFPRESTVLRAMHGTLAITVVLRAQTTRNGDDADLTITHHIDDPLHRVTHQTLMKMNRRRHQRLR